MRYPDRRDSNSIALVDNPLFDFMDLNAISTSHFALQTFGTNSNVF